MSLLCDAAYTLGALVTSPVWAWKLYRTGKYRTDWPGRFGRCRVPGKSPGKKRILFHAVSVGEVNAIVGLVDQLAAQNEIDLIIATTTDTGFARAQQVFAPRFPVVRYPLDFSVAVKRFLDAVQPDALALVELELWPQMLALCTRRRIPVCVINGRLSERSFNRYRLIKPLVKKTFARLAAAGVQTPAYADRFIALGTPRDRVHVLDTMKWDTTQLTDHLPGADELANAMGIDRHRPIVVAGSTGPGEEQLLIKACPPSAQLILVPRKPERFDEVAALAPGIVRRSKAHRATSPDQRFFLLDTMGELTLAYALSDVVVVGRSFNGMGGSDPIQPIALGKPVVIGPDTHHFADVVRAFADAQGITITQDPAVALDDLLNHPDKARAQADRGRSVIRARQGATTRHAEMLCNLIQNPPPQGNTDPHR